MREIEADTFAEVQVEFNAWIEAVEQETVEYSIALYKKENSHVAIGFYIERTADGEDSTPYVRRNQTLSELQVFFALLEDPIQNDLLPCVVCSYTTMGFVVRKIAAERAQQKHAEEREKRLAREKQAQIENREKKQANNKENLPNYQQELIEARKEIREQGLNPLQAIRRLPQRRTNTKGQKVRYDWSELEQDYEKTNGNIAAIANKMGCTSAAVRRQLKERKIGIYRNK